MSFVFLMAVVVGLPWMSYISNKNMSALEALPAETELARIPLYFQSAVMQIGVALLAWGTAVNEKIEVPLASAFTLPAILGAGALISVGIIFSWLDLRSKKQHEVSSGRLQYILPTNTKEKIAWLITIAIAAFCEEYIYRGVLFQLIQVDSGMHALIAAALSAIVFGFGHATQGERAVLIIIPFALLFQLVVYLSGGLLLAMITHFIYNAMVDVLFSKKIRARH
ncbi:MAG: CPBP family intramembrane glutamic endopeptidase [Chitinophagaceae bacterium]